MANISIRNMDKAAYLLLQHQAKKHGVSMEEEARQIIYRAVLGSKKISQIFQHYFGEENGIDLELPAHKPHQPMDFDE
jgi:plasmid stability protein